MQANPIFYGVKMAKISCFTIIRDTLSQGYPFVESIISAMPICDEFIIADGYSRDGSFEILKKLQDIYPKIELVRQEWPKVRNNHKEAFVLSQATNMVKDLCKYDYIMQLQANEVVHEASVERIRGTPDREHKGLDLFHLPFLYIIGKDLVYGEGWRIRMARNLKNIVAIADAGHLYYENASSKLFYAQIALRALSNPTKFYKIIGKHISLYGLEGEEKPFKHIYLDKPLYRYYGLFKENMIIKLRGHAELATAHKNNIYKIINYLESKEAPTFPLSWYKYMLRKDKRFLYTFLQNPYNIGLGQQPRIMQGLLKAPTKRYFVREELLRKSYFEN